MSSFPEYVAARFTNSALRILPLSTQLETRPEATHVLIVFGITGPRMYPITGWDVPNRGGIAGFYHDDLLAAYPDGVPWELVSRDVLEFYDVPADAPPDGGPRVDAAPLNARGYL